MTRRAKRMHEGLARERKNWGDLYKKGPDLGG
jgi:hypothetical protein